MCVFVEWPQSSCTDTSVLRQSNWTGVGNASHTICNPAIKWGLQFNNSNAFISSKKCYIYEVQGKYIYIYISTLIFNLYFTVLLSIETI